MIFLPHIIAGFFRGVFKGLIDGYRVGRAKGRKRVQEARERLLRERGISIR
jgi:hypothetical protein